MSEACEAGTIKGDSKYLVKDDGYSSVCVKKESNVSDVTIKVEVNECVVCLCRIISEHCDVTSSSTETGTPLYEFLYRYTHTDIANSSYYSKFICKTCFDLVNVLEHAEIEYFKLKEAFESIIKKNPLFECQVQLTHSDVLNTIKKESEQYTDSENDENDSVQYIDSKKYENKLEQYTDSRNDEYDSEDDPLALIKKERQSKPESRNKKTISTSKHKKEDQKRSQSSIDNGSDDVFRLEGLDDEDDGPSLVPGDCSDGNESNNSLLIRRKRKTKLDKLIARPQREKVIHFCDKCNAKYTSIRGLKQHMLKHEDSKPRYVCEVCGSGYKHRGPYDVHVAMHKGIGDWKCSECNKLFPSKYALKRHNNIHTRELKYECGLCGKSFIHLTSFKMHKLSHSGEKPHSCDVCGLAFMTSSRLQRHQRVHSGEKRHECTTCGRRFSERYNLLAHARLHDSEPTAPAPAPAPALPRRLFRCAFCVERFYRRYMLERHCAEVHGRSVERPPRNTAQAKCCDPLDQEKNSRGPDNKTSLATSPQ